MENRILDLPTLQSVVDDVLAKFPRKKTFVPVHDEIFRLTLMSHLCDISPFDEESDEEGDLAWDIHELIQKIAKGRPYWQHGPRYVKAEVGAWWFYYDGYKVLVEHSRHLFSETDRYAEEAVLGMNVPRGDSDDDFSRFVEVIGAYNPAWVPFLLDRHTDRSLILRCVSEGVDADLAEVLR